MPGGNELEATGVVPFLETITQCARAADHDVLLVTADEGAAGLTRLAARSLCDAIVLLPVEARIDDVERDSHCRQRTRT